MCREILDRLESAVSEVNKDFKINISVDARDIVTLSGEVPTWQDVVDIGHVVAAQDGVRNTVNDLTARDVIQKKRDYALVCRSGRKIGAIRDADVVIIGAGISGLGIARELSKYHLKIVVCEAGEDVAVGASRANNGCVHHGMDVTPGTLKSKLNVIGNARYDDWEREMDIGLIRCGCIEVAQSEDERHLLDARFEQGRKNGVPGMRIVDQKEAYRLEPALEREGIPVCCALWMPTHGLVETPYVCTALAENAAMNGVEFIFDCMVGDIIVETGRVYGVVTEKGIINARYAVNAAGIFADDIAEMAGDRMYTLHGRQGTLAVFDKATPPTFKAMTAIIKPQVRIGKAVNSKGGGENSTPENNLIAGPSSHEVPDKENVDSTPDGMAYIDDNCLFDVHNPRGNIIRLFAGVRPADYKEDFIIEMSEIVDGFIHVAGIQSPGVAAAPAIADLVVSLIIEDLAKKGIPVESNKAFNPIRKRTPEFRHMTKEQQNAVLLTNPLYGRIVCRCEQITEGEIIDVLRSPVPPRSVNAVKNRVRAGMGRCQGGFCQPRVVEILARELRLAPTDVTLKGKGSEILVCDNREGH